MPKSYEGFAVRAALFVALVAAPALAAESDDGPAPEEAPQNLPPLEVYIDKAKVDLEAHRLELRMSRKAGRVVVKVFDEQRGVIAEEEHDFAGRPANSLLKVSWSAGSDEKVARIEVFAYDAYGYYKGVALVPWSLSVPHEEVNFATDSATIRDSEVPKLEQSRATIVSAVEQHKELGSISLYIAGHTDTVGSAAHNLELSRKRARAIAAWFQKRGLPVPIAFAGFGESALVVKTGDEVDEPRNRRVDYVLAIEAPVLKTSGRTPAWQKL
jgi:outer membrane protein OmpA-like peptidoglycan-associated protein